MFPHSDPGLIPLVIAPPCCSLARPRLSRSPSLASAPPRPRHHPRAVLNKPWFPSLVCELKSTQGTQSEVDYQLRIAMYFALNLYTELEHRAKDKDPETFATLETDDALRRLYGLSMVGEQWSLWMMCRSDREEPYYVSDTRTQHVCRPSVLSV